MPQARTLPPAGRGSGGGLGWFEPVRRAVVRPSRLGAAAPARDCRLAGACRRPRPYLDRSARSTAAQGLRQPALQPGRRRVGTARDPLLRTRRSRPTVTACRWAATAMTHARLVRRTRRPCGSTNGAPAAARRATLRDGWRCGECRATCPKGVRCAVEARPRLGRLDLDGAWSRRAA